MGDVTDVDVVTPVVVVFYRNIFNGLCLFLFVTFFFSGLCRNIEIKQFRKLDKPIVAAISLL